MYFTLLATSSRFLRALGKLPLSLTALIVAALSFAQLRADTLAGAPLPGFVSPTGTGAITLAKWLPDGGALYVSARTTHHLFADGSLDTAYTSHTFNLNTKAMLVQADGRVLLGGLYTQVDGNFRTYLVRLEADGTLDTAFPTFAGTGILTLAPGADGKFYVGNTNGSGLLRYNADGTRDTAFFSPTVGFGQIGGKVWAVKELADGSVLVAHQTSDNSTFGTVTGWYVQRLSSTGAIDPNFNGATLLGPATALDVLPDGRIVIAGPFASVDGDTGHASIALLHTDGSLDTTFNTGTPRFLGDSDSVDVIPPSVRAQDGKILLGGRFTTVSGQTVGNLVRYNLDGTLDSTFAFGTGLKFNGLVASMELTPAGDIFVAGSFTGFTGSSAGTLWRAALLSGQTVVTTPKQDQHITFDAPASRTFAAGAFTLAPGSDSGLAVQLELVGGPATLAKTETGYLVTPTDAGEIVLRATQPGDSAYRAAEALLRTVKITGKLQTITFALPATRGFGDGPLTLTATATSRLTVVMELVGGPATLAKTETGYLLTPTDAGSIVIRVSQAGGSGFDPAPSFTRTIKITGKRQTITFAPPSAGTYGAAPLALAATASSGLPVSLELVSGPASLVDGALTPSGAGNVVLKATQPGGSGFDPAAAATRTIKIAKARLVVSAQNATRLVGLANPVFVPNYISGFVGEGDASALTRQPVFVTKATKGSSQGVYDITLQAGSDANYTFVAGAPGKLTVAGFGGAYEALLFNPALSFGDRAAPLGKLELEVVKTGLSYSGTLTLADVADPIAIRGSLTAADPALATASWTPSPKVTALAGLVLQLGLAGDSLEATLTRPAKTTLVSLASGVRLSDVAVAGYGAHTLVLSAEGSVLDADDARALPSGTGHAVATIAQKTGVLTLKGKLGDGVALTGAFKPSALPADAGAGHRVFIKPYGKRLDSSLGGELALLPFGETTRVHGRDGLLFWSKAASPENAKTPDAACRQGFGPLAVAADIEPWFPPSAAKRAKGPTPAVAAITLAQRLGLADDENTAGEILVQFPEDLDLGARGASLPVLVRLDAKDKLSVLEPAAAAVKTTQWKLSVASATGVITGSFELLDQVPAPTATNELATKPVKRPVAFSGTLRQGPEGDDAVIGVGCLLVAPLPAAKGAEQTAVTIRFVRAIE